MAGRRGRARELACCPTAFRPRPAGLHRRDLGHHQYDAAVSRRLDSGWLRRSRTGTGKSSSWTISAVTRSPVCATPSRPVAPPSFACRPTAPTEIRSSKPSPSSKPCCESSPRAPSQASGTPSVTCSIASPPRNAPTILPAPDMFRSIGIRSLEASTTVCLALRHEP